MSLSELINQLERLLEWATTDLMATALSAEGLTYLMLLGVPLLISLLYLRFRQ